MLVEFTADWCPPCKMIAPIVDQLARQYEGKLRVVTLNSDAYPELVQRYDVLGLPTLILYASGAPIQRIVGFKPRERIEAALLPYLQQEHA